MVDTEYFGKVSIEYWEYSLLLFYLFAMYFYFARKKNILIKKNPEYKYFLWGLYAKIFGGVFFSLIYFYYYTGGDTTSYFYSSLAVRNLAHKDIGDYLHVLFGDNSLENRQYFDMTTGYPYTYVYADDRAYMVVRLINPLILLTFDSYLNTTVMVAGLSYFGIWRCYQTFVRYYPNLSGRLAIAILFMPSSIFWGSAILKDTFSFSALCWYVHAMDNIALRKRDQVSSWFILALSSYMLIAIKPYIFMILFPVSLIWVNYGRLAGIRNNLIKYIVVPGMMIFLMAATLVVLNSLDERLGKFSLNNSLDTILVAQNDMKRSEEYGANYFDVGEFDHTWSGVLSKLPVATAAALFRPFLWESKNPMMFLAGLENLFVLLLALRVVIRARFFRALTLFMKNSLVMMCILFALFYGFITGITTPNFGALVRFKIPLLPLFISALFIMDHILEVRKRALNSGRPFQWSWFARGEPLSMPGRTDAGGKQRPDLR